MADDGDASRVPFPVRVSYELTSNGSEPFEYNPAGELTKRTVTATGATTTCQWNQRGELLAVRLPDGKTESYAYDPLGRRVSASNGTNATSYVYDRSRVHLKHESGSSSPTAVYTAGPRSEPMLEMARGAKRYSYLVDGQGSTIALADEHGNVVQRYSYNAFGNPTITGSLANAFTHTGQQWDAETGLYYYGARYYDPSTGGFLSRDPITHVNPYVYLDPSLSTNAPA